MREPADPLREPPPPPIREARIAIRYWRDWARNLAIGAAAGLFLALVGALQTGEAPLATRLLYWAPLMMAGVLVGGGVATVATRAAPPGFNIWALGALIALGVALVSAGVIAWYSNLLFGVRFSAREAPGFFGLVLLVSAAMTAIMILANRPGAQTHAPAPGAPAPSVRFLDRLPPKLRGATLHAVEAEDHYLRVHTSKGGDLILMRLGDAIAELEGIEGAQVHRSWWVAKDAVDGVSRANGRVVLQLKGGVTAPVSRANVAPLRTAGWF